MALLQKQYDAANMNTGARFRYGVQHKTENHGFFASPTESEFSEHFDSNLSIRNWDEERVSQWLRSINCPQYVELFLVNNINGACLIELDRNHLREMGVRKVGDQIRIAAQAKKFRNAQYQHFSKRQANRDSLALLDKVSFVPSLSGSPKPGHRHVDSTQSTRQEKRLSKLMDLPPGTVLTYGKSNSRPTSPYIEERRNGSQKYTNMSPPQQANYPPGSAATVNGKPPTSGGRYGYPPHSGNSVGKTPKTATFPNHIRGSPSIDQGPTTAILPADKPFIRVIYDTGNTSVVNIDGWKTVEDVILKALRNKSLNESHTRNYCFYVLDGTEPNPALCRRINDDEVRRICSDPSRSERNRLILRKIHMGEPDEQQIKTAAAVAAQQQLQQTYNMVLPANPRSQLKIEKITGESLPPVSYPPSPQTMQNVERHRLVARERTRLADPPARAQHPRTRKIKELFGGRPPSELIASDLATYFPEYEKEQIDRTVRNSIRRSRRISRAASRLSTISTFSIASSLKDAPPLPAISDAWLGGQNQGKGLRPSSIMRLGGPGFRDSMASTVLEPLDEESPLESDRKSYVSSFGNNSEISVTDAEGATMKSYYDDASVAASSVSGAGENDSEDSLSKRLSQMVQEDSEEEDEELQEYLENPDWDDIKYMKGNFIGKGSFGSVYLALHAITGVFMAVKQVELPQDDLGNKAKAAKSKAMLTALKHEISLLRELTHPNIVQYLGSNSDDTHLNIFLEYVPGGSVASMLVNYGPLGESLIANFVRQILTGLCYLHSKDIIHRDIKGANILVDNKGSVKISDFGISKRMDMSGDANGVGAPLAGTRGQRSSLQGSVYWMAPEVVQQTAYTLKADIWSLGCLIIEMFTGTHPHPTFNTFQALFHIGSKTLAPTIPEKASDKLKAFLERTFDVDHARRPGAQELLESEWVTGVMEEMGVPGGGDKGKA